MAGSESESAPSKPKRRTTSFFGVVDDDGKPRVPTGLVVVALSLLVAVLIGVILFQLGSILRPLAIAFFLCYLILPAHRGLVGVNVPRVISYVVISFAIIVMMTVLSRAVYVNAASFTKTMPQYRLRLARWLAPVDEFISSLADSTLVRKKPENPPKGDERSGPRPADEEEAVARFPLANLIYDQMQSPRLTPIITALFGTFFGFLATGFIILIYLMFLIAEADAVRRRVHHMFEPAAAERALSILGAINRGIADYIRVKTFVSVIVGALTTVVLWAFGVDFFVVWGILALLLNFVPFVGSIVAGALPTLLTFLQFESPWYGVVVGVLLLGVQTSVAYVLEPRLAGRRLNLSPLVILLALAFWGWLWGIVGAVLAVPMVVILRIVFENIEQTRPIAALMSNEPSGVSR